MRWAAKSSYLLLPGIVFVLALLVQAAVLWFNTTAREEQLHTEVEVTAQQAARRLETWINDRIAIGDYLVSRVETDYRSPTEYLRDAQALFDAFGGLQAINWVEPDGTIGLVYPSEGNEPALGRNLHEHPSASVREAFAKAGETRTPHRTNATVELLQGGRGFVAYFPAESPTGELIGFINVVFRVSEVVENCLDPRFLSSFRSAIVTESGQEVYSSTPGVTLDEWDRAQSAEVVVLGRSMTLTVSPLHHPSREYFWLSWTSVLGSLAIATALAFAAYYTLGLIERSRVSERNLVQFASSVHEVFWLASPDFKKVYYISPGYEAVWGRELDDSLYDNPQWWLASVIQEDRDKLMKGYREIVEGGFEHNDLPLHRIQRADGQIRWLEARVYPIRDPAGEIVRVAGVDEDVTARIAAGRERESLIAAIEQTAESVAITDADGILLYANRAYEKTHNTSRSECIGHRASELAALDPETEHAVWRAMDQGIPWTAQVESGADKSSVTIAEITISPVMDSHGARCNLVIIGRDVSRELQLERQLLQSQRLESVGLLAGGVAHDFNNLLQAIYGYVDLAQMHLSDAAQTSSYLESMRAAIERARQHVRKILLYARRAERRHEAWPVQDIVREVTRFLRPSTPSTIRFEVNIDETCPPALISPSDIHQVLVNLCTNAFHAMPKGGLLRIGVHKAAVQDSDRLKPGDYVQLVVEDSGVGIAQEDLFKIFDPYFTTKGKDEGTGLGLSVVQTIISAHGGDVRVQSAPERGTRFEIYLPVAGSESEQPAPIAVDGGAPFYPAHVLLVDDDPAVLKVLKASLISGGFTVDAFTDPIEALAQFRHSPDAYDIVITDQTMPNLKGLDLAERLHKERRDVPIVLCSGLDQDMDDLRSELISRRLTKPVRPSELNEAVRRLLAPRMRLTRSTTQ